MSVSVFVCSVLLYFHTMGNELIVFGFGAVVTHSWCNKLRDVVHFLLVKLRTRVVAWV